MAKFIVKYSLAYDHVVSVGIEASCAEGACEMAEALSESGTLWDDTPTVPMLEDVHREREDNVLIFSAEAVKGDEYPSADATVRQVREAAAYRRVAELFLQAYRRGEEAGGSVDWSDLDAAWEVAVKAGLPGTSGPG